MTSSGKPCEHVVPVEQEPRHRTVLTNEFVRVLAVEIAAHERTLCHHHEHDYLLYVLDIADIVSTDFSGNTQTLAYYEGECQLLQAGLVHVVENLRDIPFRNIVIEKFSRFGELLRSVDPKLKYTDEIFEAQRLSKLKEYLKKMNLSSEIEGMTELMTRIRPGVENEVARIFRSKLKDKTEVRVCGPGIVTSLEGEAIWQQDGAVREVKVRGFRDVVWVPPNVQGVLRGNGSVVLIFQLGATGEQRLGVRKESEPLRSLREHAQIPDDLESDE